MLEPERSLAPGCPTDDELASLLEGDLIGSEHARVHAHCAECSRCRDVLELAGSPEPPDSPETRRLSAGTGLGRYVVLESIGAGAMGVVYSAYDPRLDRRIAIKVLGADREPLGRQAWQARLLREARAMAAITHPNVLTIHDAGEYDDGVFIAMELVQGSTLRGWLKQTRTVDEVLRVFVAAGRGLAAAHARDLIHRDFKPDNVLIDDDGRVLVADFGLARFGDQPRSEVDNAAAVSEAAQVTRTGALVGTPAYMPPEQLQGAVVDARSDQFAFCVALYEALYGNRPFSGATIAMLFDAIREQELTPGRPLGRVPSSVRAAIQRGLSAEPSSRFSAMDGLVAKIDVTRLRRWLPPSLLGAGLFVGAIGAGAWTRAEALPACEDLSTAAADAYSQDVRESLAHTLHAVGNPEAWERLQTRLGAFADSWAEVKRETCVAERSASVPSPVLSARNTCLYRSLLHYRVLLGELERGATTSIFEALSAVSNLPSSTSCAGLSDDSPASARASSEAVEEALAHAKAAFGLSDKAGVLAWAERARAAAEANNDLHGQARALIKLASDWSETDTKQAEALLQRAIRMGIELDDRTLAARGWNRLAFMLIYGRRSLSEAALAADMAEAEAAAAGAENPRARLDRVRTRIELESARGNFEAAKKWLNEAHALLEELDDPKATLTLKSTEAQLMLTTGEYEKMATVLQEIHDARLELYGPKALDVLTSRINIGIALVRLERFAEAEVALEGLADHFDDSTTRAIIVWTIGDARAGQEDLEGALTHFDEAMTLLTSEGEPKAHRMLELRLRRIDVLLRLNRLDDASEELDLSERLRADGGAGGLGDGLDDLQRSLAAARGSTPVKAPDGG